MRVLVADFCILLLYVVSAVPAITGPSLHEWLGLAVLLVLFGHCVAHADWVAAALRAPGRNAPKLALAVLMLGALVTTVVSGVMISGAVLPMLGLYAPGYHFWYPLHAFAAKLLLTTLLVHLVLHIKWAAAVIDKEKRNDSRNR